MPAAPCAGPQELSHHRLDGPEPPIGVEGVDEGEARRVGVVGPAGGATVAVEPDGLEAHRLQAANLLELLGRAGGPGDDDSPPSGNEREALAELAVGRVEIERSRLLVAEIEMHEACRLRR